MNPAAARRARPLLDEREAVVAALLTLAGVAVLDLVTPDSTVFSALTMLGPFVAAVGARPRATATIGAAATVLSVVLGWFNGVLDEWDFWLRAGLVAVAAGLAFTTASYRAAREEAANRMRRAATVTQRAILRPPPPRLGNVELAARYLSADADTLVGGDLFETAYTPWGVRLLVGDAKGRGLEALELSAGVLAAFREHDQERDLTSVAAALDRAVAAVAGAEDFVTAVLVELPKEPTVRVVNLGHLAPVRVRGATVERLQDGPSSPPLGLHPVPRLLEFPFDDGDCLVLVTDGLTEARSGGGAFFPLETALRDLGAAGRCSPDDLVRGVVDRLTDHVGDALHDDLTLLVACRTDDPPNWRQ